MVIESLENELLDGAMIADIGPLRCLRFSYIKKNFREVPRYKRLKGFIRKNCCLNIILSDNDFEIKSKIYSLSCLSCFCNSYLILDCMMTSFSEFVSFYIFSNCQLAVVF